MIANHISRKQFSKIKNREGQKYHSSKACVDGIIFDSKKEAERYQELLLLEKAGDISNLQRQVPFELIPSQKRNGKVVERSCKYVADFCYTDKNGNSIVEDTKGFHTKDYIIKRKLMLEKFDIIISEI